MAENNSSDNKEKKQANFFTFLFNPSQFLKEVGDSETSEAVVSVVNKSTDFLESSTANADTKSKSDIPKENNLTHVPPPGFSEVKAAASNNLLEVPGSLFAGRYQIISATGRGATSNVYKARHIQLDRIVAVKVMHPHLLEDASTKIRFEQEAKATSNLSHINLVLIHDFGICPKGRPFLVMDYVDGPSLEDVIDEQGFLPQQVFAEVFVQCCRGLSHAHKKGLVHRDIKPGNVRITKNDEGETVVKILDFGIAKSFIRQNKQSQSLTELGSVLGSPLFMSPEQCRAEAVDQRTDVYSLGVAMYLAATGKYPFIGKEAFETLYKHIYEPTPKFESLNLPFPSSSAIERIVHRAMQKAPEDRYQSMEELEKQLLQLIQGATNNRMPTAFNSPVNSASLDADPVAIDENEKDKKLHISDFDQVGFQKYLAKFSYYDLLQADSGSTTEQIHKNYFKRVRSLLRSEESAERLADWQLGELIRRINIAHQVLTDPNLRADYETSSETESVIERLNRSVYPSGSLFEISELIRLFKLVGDNSEQILSDIREQNPNYSENELVTTLVERGLLREDDVESLKQARYLLATNKLSIGQLELVMSELVGTQSTLWVALVAKGWIKMSDLS